MRPKKNVHYIGKRSGLGRKPKWQTIEYETTKKPKPELKPIQGQMPDSKEEYWVALALYKMKLRFEYQYELFGGRRYHGGQLVDFFVYTNPLPTPILVQGWYFHYATAAVAARSKYNLMMIRDMCEGYCNPPIEILDYEIPTEQMTYEVVKRKLKGE